MYQRVYIEKEENFIVYFLFICIENIEKEEFEELIKEEKYNELIYLYEMREFDTKYLQTYKKEYNLIINIFKRLKEDESLIDDIYKMI
jgi:hypothetical protein